jgi:osmotically-inducible protein OsmY
VSDRLTDAPFLDASDVEVTVKNGEVTLSGTVPNREQKRRSEDLIEHVTGVRELHNALRISRVTEGTHVGP